MRLYGKDRLKQRLDDYAAANRLPHAILLCGERGTGRLVMARYIAKLFLCGKSPCGTCPTCTKIDADAHPDIIFVKRECGGKYNLDETGKGGLVSMRRVMESIVVKPNDGDIKIYVFEDADEMSVQLQNTLLKIIEEPAPFLRFVFTCESSDPIIETIRSRVTDLDVPKSSVQECAQCLIEQGTPADKANELADALSGNIGKCLDVLSGGGDTPFMDCAGRAAAAIADKDGFTAAAVLAEQSGRAEFSAVLGYLTEILRDALSCRCGGELSSCAKQQAKRLAEVYSEEQLLDMLDAVFKVTADAGFNINMALTASYLTSKLI
ncbi:MAG: hypothetical protein IJD85_08420 [Oscillospiraceae bacterium]|nr:hypothetical protein [Oscillospiraceae bacterium]